jgi:hypothetical protein
VLKISSQSSLAQHLIVVPPTLLYLKRRLWTSNQRLTPRIDMPSRARSRIIHPRLHPTKVYPTPGRHSIPNRPTRYSRPYRPRNTTTCILWISSIPQPRTPEMESQRHAIRRKSGCCGSGIYRSRCEHEKRPQVVLDSAHYKRVREWCAEGGVPRWRMGIAERRSASFPSTVTWSVQMPVEGIGLWSRPRRDDPGGHPTNEFSRRRNTNTAQEYV